MRPPWHAMTTASLLLFLAAALNLIAGFGQLSRGRRSGLFCLAAAVLAAVGGFIELAPS